MESDAQAPAPSPGLPIPVQRDGSPGAPASVPDDGVVPAARRFSSRLPSGAAFRGVFTAVVVPGMSVLILALHTVDVRSLESMGAPFYVISAMLVMIEFRALITARDSDPYGITPSTSFVFALLLMVGPGPAIVMQAVATAIADTIKRKSWWRLAFNVSQLTLAFSAAGYTMALLGYRASPSQPAHLTVGTVPVIAAAGAVYFVVNVVLVSAIITARDGSSFWEEIRSDLVSMAAADCVLLASAPLLVVIAENAPFLAPLFLLPLVAVYVTAWMSQTREHEALHDGLTGLPNRRMLNSEADRSLDVARRTGTVMGVIVIDLDRFKEVNDTLGHAVGDELLRLVARRLADSVGDHGLVARFGGDEFGILLPDLGSREEGIVRARLVHQSMIDPFHIGAMSFDLEASVGVAFFPEHGDDVAGLIQRADVAMYLAKHTHTGVEVYVADRDRNSAARLGLLGQLRSAMEVGELVLHYQPKARLADGVVDSVETLVRWQHPVRGLIGPDEFVPLAEQSGLIRLLGNYVIDAALLQVRTWRDQGIDIPVAVNISVRNLHDAAFARFVADRLDFHGVPASSLELEVTEGVLMDEPERVAPTLAALDEMGVALSLDDFGTGYSSLLQLKRLPVSEIKIDKSFVLRMDVNDEDAAIVRSIIDLGRALGLRTVAEGVETHIAWDMLRAYGADIAQGWFLSRPMASAPATEWLAAAFSAGGVPPTLSEQLQG